MLNWLKNIFTPKPSEPEVTNERKKKKSKRGGWTQVAHTRKGHYRTYRNGKKVWIPEKKINA